MRGLRSSPVVPTRRSWRRQSRALLSTAWWEDKKQQAYIDTGGVQTGYRKTLSPCEDSKQWDRLPGEAVQPPSLEVLQTCLEKARSNLFWPHGFIQGVGREPFWGPCQPESSPGPMKILCHETLWPPEPLALCSTHGHLNPFPLNVQATPLL